MRGPFLKFAHAECGAQSEKAIKVEIADDPGWYWIPKDHVHDDSECFEPGLSGTLIITKWIAEQKGIDGLGEEYEP